MKKIIIIFSIILLTIITSVIIVSDLNDDNYDSISQNKEPVKNNNLYTMMLETEVGSGEYVESTSGEWPTDDYVLNQRLSGCKNGSEISFDEEKKVVYVSATGNDSCYVYFSKGILFADYIKDLYVSDGDNDLYLHDGIGTYGELEAGDNSYRYAGADPNNYVCFGTDEEACPIDNLYRIIGVFGDYVKLIKDINWMNQVWDSNSNAWNDVTKPDIRESLNTTFLNTFDENWQNKIATYSWKVGGGTSANLSRATVQKVYNNEVGNASINITDTMKTGLMYISDYGYAATPDNWTRTVYNYNNARDYNWLYRNVNQWTISTNIDDSTHAFYVGSAGRVNNVNAVTSNYTTRPTFYLNTNVTYVSGTGTSSDPYKIQ